MRLLRAFALTSTIFASSTSAVAASVSTTACNANNCLRAVRATAFPARPTSIAKSDCAAFQTTTTTIFSTVTATVTSSPARKIKRHDGEVHSGLERRAAKIPAYASACSGSQDYASACSCFGVTSSTSTATSVVTVTTTATPSMTGPTCPTGTTYAILQYGDIRQPTYGVIANDTTYPLLIQNTSFLIKFDSAALTSSAGAHFTFVQDNDGLCRLSYGSALSTVVNDDIGDGIYHFAESHYLRVIDPATDFSGSQHTPVSCGMAHDSHQLVCSVTNGTVTESMLQAEPETSTLQLRIDSMSYIPTVFYGLVPIFSG